MARTMAQKLGIKEGSTVYVFAAPAGYADTLDGLPAGATLSDRGEGPFDAIHLFVANKATLEDEWDAAQRKLKPGGLMWIAYPKKSSGVETDISRDHG